MKVEHMLNAQPWIVACTYLYTFTYLKHCNTMQHNATHCNTLQDVCPELLKVEHMLNAQPWIVACHVDLLPDAVP